MDLRRSSCSATFGVMGCLNPSFLDEWNSKAPSSTSSSVPAMGRCWVSFRLASNTQTWPLGYLGTAFFSLGTILNRALKTHITSGQGDPCGSNVAAGQAEV